MWSINSLNYKIDFGYKDKVAIDGLTKLNFDIPRFCYHENLKIAGNCRMCLIEDSKAPKPIICCAMSIVPDLSIFTNTLRVKKARESVMEFLLINHPLDCPICDQGGECDLQDLALVYGADHGRFYEYKRNVEDKNCGIIVKTIMNRCILCTRCVRYSLDVMNFNSFGLTGRGSKMEIGSYVESLLSSELSGNLVDVCPVGALTSKPYSFAARPWELKKISLINIFDDYTQQLRGDVKENSLIRIQPSKNNIPANIWITNRTRFSYEGLKRSRLLLPTLNNVEVSWVDFIFVYSKIVSNSILKTKNNNINFLSTQLFDFTDITTIVSAKTLSVNVGSAYLKTQQFIQNYVLPLSCELYEAPITTRSVILLVGLILEWDAPILNILLNNSNIEFIALWNSKISIKNIDIFYFLSSTKIFLNYLSNKHWLNSILNNKQLTFKVLFYNSIFTKFFEGFLSDVQLIPVYLGGASTRTLNILLLKELHNQNNLLITSNVKIDVSPKLNNKYSSLLSLKQTSYKNIGMFVLPTQLLYEQSNTFFYDNNYLKVQANKAVVTLPGVKSNYQILNMFINLFNLKGPNSFIASYDKNTTLRKFVSYFSWGTKIHLLLSSKNQQTTRISYFLTNSLSQNSSIALSSARLDNYYNIYNT